MGLRRRPGRGDGVVDVELVDAADEAAPRAVRSAVRAGTTRRRDGARGRWSPGPDAQGKGSDGWLVDPRPDPPPPRRSRRRRVAVLAAALAVVTVGTVATVRQSTQDALLAGLGQGGVALLPLDRPLTERWRTDAETVSGDMGSFVLVQDEHGTRALDARTGAVRWERELAPAGSTEVCRPLEEHAGRSLPAVGPQGAATSPRALTMVVCLRTSPVGELVDAVPSGDAARTTTATVVDGASGEPGRALTVAGAVVASHVDEGDLLLVTAADDATLRLTRWHPDTGGVRWRREVEPADAAGLRFAGWQQGILTVAGRAGTVAYSLDSGRELRVTEPLPPHVVAVERRLLPRGGVEVVWGHHADPTFPGGAGVLVHPDEREVVLPGPPLRVAVDDGSAPGLVLVATSPTTVGAVDVADGALRWEAAHGAASQVTVRADGVAVLVDGAVATAVDVRTGEALWRVDGLTRAPGALGLTDGERVLLRHASDDGDQVAAHDLRTGEAAWEVPLPDGTQDLVGLAEGRVLAVGPGWVAGLG